MAQKRLSADEWKSVRKEWEYDPGEPTYAEAGKAASEKHKFVAPGKTTIESRAKKEGWERRGSLKGINEAAQRKADRMVKSDGSPTDPDAGPPKKLDASESTAGADVAARDESEDKRAEVLARHRKEWAQVAVLRQESLQRRTADPVDAFNRAKLAKITAEITTLQQAGERKAWGMELVIDPSQFASMSDAQLEAIVAGKAPK